MTRIADTKYASYLKDRYQTEILEDNTGFIFYRITGAECFISEMQVNAEARGKGNGRALYLKLEELAKECHYISATIYIAKPGHEVILSAALKLGFKVRRAEGDVLLVTKNLLGD